MAELASKVVTSFVDFIEDSTKSASLEPPALAHAIRSLIENYWRLHSLLIFLSLRCPGIINHAAYRLEKFIDDQHGTARTKRRVPDLQEFLMIMTVLFHFQATPSGNSHPQKSPLDAWRSRLVGPFMSEFFVRQTHSLLQAEPTLEIRQEGGAEDDFRLSLTFMHSKKNLRALMFQVRFMKAVVDSRMARPATDGPAHPGVGEGYGYGDFPPLDLWMRMCRETKDILAVDSWPGFFDMVGWTIRGPTPVTSTRPCPATSNYASQPALNKEEFAKLLRNSIVQSARLRYHRPVGFLPRDQKERNEAGVSRWRNQSIMTHTALTSQRWWVEKEWSFLHGGSKDWTPWGDAVAEVDDGDQLAITGPQISVLTRKHSTSIGLAIAFIKPFRHLWLAKHIVRRILIAAALCFAARYHGSHF